MKKTSRRLAAVLLSLVMLMGMIPQHAFADGEAKSIADESSLLRTSRSLTDEKDIPEETKAEADIPEETKAEADLPEEKEPETKPEAETTEAVQDKTVRVIFKPEQPETIIVVFSSSEKDADGNWLKIGAEEPNCFKLTPGEYFYSAACDGYVSVELEAFSVKAPEKDETEQIIPVALKAAEQEPALPAEGEEKTEETEAPESIEGPALAYSPAPETMLSMPLMNTPGTRSLPLSEIYILFNGEGSVTVTFHANGGTGADYTQTFESNSAAQALYENQFTREGWTFNGWGLSQYPSRVYRTNAIIEITGNTDLYAVWDDAPEGYTNLFSSALYGDTLCTMADDGNGGVIITDMRSWAPNETIGDPGSPTKIYIPTTYQGKTITAIGERAFYSKGLTGVKFAAGSQITAIGNSAFSSNADMSGFAMSLPTTVTSIGSYAFYNTFISSVNFAELTNLTTLDTGSFSYCLLKALDLTNTKVTVIPDSCFNSGSYSYNTINNPVLHPQTTSIGENALNSAYGNITIPATVTSIGAGAFNYPKNNINIDVSALSSEFVASVYQNLLGAWNGYMQRMKIIFPSSWYENDTEFIIYNGTIYGVKDSWTGGALNVPAGISSSLARGAFATRPAQGLTSLVFAGNCTYTSLPSYLCAGQSGLTSVSFPNSLQNIGSTAFRGSGLTSLNLPEGLLRVYSSAFYGCNGLTEVQIPASVKQIDSDAFANCRKLASVTLGTAESSALTTISSDAFSVCPALTDIYVPSVTESQGNLNAPWQTHPWGATNAVMHWKDNNSVPQASVVVDANGVRWGYDRKTGRLLYFLGVEEEVDGEIVVNEAKTSATKVSITIPTQVYELDDRSTPIGQVNSLRSYLLGGSGTRRYFDTVTVPGSFGTVGSYVLGSNSTDGLTYSCSKIILQEGITTLASQAFYASPVIEVVLPSTLTSIGSSAFYSSDIRSIDLPEGLKSIGESAFSRSAIGRSSKGIIVIPKSVETIGAGVFSRCTYLKVIRYRQYRYEENLPADGSGKLVHPSWIDNSFGALHVGTSIYYLDDAVIRVELVGNPILNDVEQTTTVIARAIRRTGVIELETLAAVNHENIVNFHLMDETDTNWNYGGEAFNNDTYLYVSLTVSADGEYYCLGSFKNTETGVALSTELPITVANTTNGLAYDINGGLTAAGHDMPEDVTRLTGTHVTVAAFPEGVNRYGYSLGASWNTEADGSGTPYAPGATLTLDDDYTLYLQWTVDPAKTYTVSYTTNDTAHGTLSVASNGPIQVLSSEGVTGSTVSLAEGVVGYHLAGWYQGTTQVTASAELTPDQAKANLLKYNNEAYKDTTYTASVQPNTYTVTFSKNANDATGNMDDLPMTYDAAATLPASGFSLTGYSVSGWATSANGDKVYDDQASVSNLTAENNGTVTLYAVWTPITYTVRFHANDGTNSTSDQTMTYDVAANLRANAFTRTGWSFAGWAAEENGTKVYDNEASVENLTTTAGAVIDLYALWESTVAVTVTGGTKNDAVYSGAEQNFGDYTVVYTMNGETVEESDLPAGITVSKDVTEASGTNVGTYTGSVTISLSGTVTGVTLPAAAAGDTITLVIGPKDAFVTADDKTKISGAADPALTATVTGTFGNDSLNYTIDRAPGDEDGTYEITVSGEADQGNYSVTFVNGTLTVYSYNYTAGENQTWTKGSSEALEFTVKCSYDDETTFDRFTGIQIDGQDIDPTKYGAVSGSVKLTLDPALLNTLSVGEHTLTASFEDGGKAETKFTVEEAETEAETETDQPGSDIPQTGDESRMLLWNMLSLLSMLGLSAVLFVAKRRRTQE